MTRILAMEQRSRTLLVAGVALLFVLVYAGLSSRIAGGGFPLDDAWIHQTYARNLIRSGRWEFVSGQVSAGSTSPLWTLLISLGYLLRLPHLAWTYTLGWLSLALLGREAMRLWSILWPARAGQSLVVGLVVVAAWQMVWAAVSGMETLLFSALSLSLVIVAIERRDWTRRAAFQRGFLGALLILVRPEGLLLVVLALAAPLAAGKGSVRDKFIASLVSLLGIALPLAPYFALNLASGSGIWPNTFYAKQAEYTFLWQESIILRFNRLLLFTLGGPENGWRGISGAHLLLAPGLLVSGWLAVRRDVLARKAFYALPLLWAAGHIFLFAWRLPVSYQHGRYTMPVVPVFILYGLAGWMEWGDWLRRKMSGPVNRRLNFVLNASSRLTFTSMIFIFLALGLQATIDDVSLINGEMVTVSRWVRDNTPPDALVAAHDIGAMGYFAERSLIDLAGLISPEIVPYLSDQEAIAAYVDRQSADYLVTAPGWPYEAMVNARGARLIYQSGYLPTREAGFNNMAVIDLGRRP